MYKEQNISQEIEEIKNSVSAINRAIKKIKEKHDEIDVRVARNLDKTIIFNLDLITPAIDRHC